MPPPAIDDVVVAVRHRFAGFSSYWSLKAKMKTIFGLAFRINTL